MFYLTSREINRSELIQDLQNQAAGALVTFEGWVRNHNQGNEVSSLEYEVYPELSISEGNKIIQEARDRFNVHHIVCSHRYGHLGLGQIAVWVGAIASHRDDAFKASRYVIDEIKLRLPIWKKEHYTNQKPEWVFCRDHHSHVHFSESEYYKKQSQLVAQEKLKQSKVVVVGAGGLGCTVLPLLTAAGVGRLEIIDSDNISISNIHRQNLYSPDLVGEKKVVVAKNKLKSLNPFIKIVEYPIYLTSENAEQYLYGKSLVIDCTDNLQTKNLIHDMCYKLRIPFISASVFKFEGQVRTFVPGNKKGCIHCSGSEAPEDDLIGNCNDSGVIGSTVSMMGSIQANEAISFLQNGSNSTIDSTFFFNLQSLSQFKIKNFVNDQCKYCAGDFDFHESDLEISAENLSKLNAVLLDLRDKPDQILDDYFFSDLPVVLVCKRGIRSKTLAKKMHLQGFKHFYSLKGGVCSL